MKAIIIILIVVGILAFTVHKLKERVTPGEPEQVEVERETERTTATDKLKEFARSGQKENEAMTWFSYKLKNPPSESLTKLLSESTQNGDSKVIVDEEKNSVSGKIPETELNDFISFLATQDTKPKQVSVDVVLMIADLQGSEEFSLDFIFRSAGLIPLPAEIATDTRRFGVRKLFDGPDKIYDGAISGGLVSVNAGPLEMALKNLSSSGKVRIVARPSLGVQLGKPSRLASGREIGVVTTDSLNGNAVSSVDYREVALSLEITVRQIDGAYQLQVDQGNDDVIGQQVVNGNIVPELSTQNVQTILALPAGQWGVAGSVSLQSFSESESGLKPFQKLFGEKRKTSQRLEVGVLVRVVDGLREEVQKVPDDSPDLLPFASAQKVQASPKRKLSDLFKKRTGGNSSTKRRDATRRKFGR